MNFQILLILLILGLAGCASMSKEQCIEAQSTSWERFGRIDGRDGWDPDQRMAMHRDACKEVGIQPDPKTYMRGWKIGVVEYCTPDRAYSVGLSGSSGNSRVCPPEFREIFEDNVELGLRIHNLRSQISSLDYEIDGYENRLRDPKLDNETRRDLRSRIRHRDGEISHLRMLLREAEAQPIIRH